MLVIAGLGNPGSTYDNTRHNIGFMAVDAIHRYYNFAPWRNKFQALIADGQIDGVKVLLVKPQTYMNNSGQSLAAIMQFYKLSLDDIVVFHDELDLVPNKLRIKTGGSAGGHNGIRSIDAHCGKNYRRIRLGIGHPGHGQDLVHNYVLGPFTKSENKWLEPLLTAIAADIAYIVNNDANGFMNKVFNQTHATPPQNKVKAKKNSNADKHGLMDKQGLSASKTDKQTSSSSSSKDTKAEGPMAEMLKKLKGKI